MTRPDVDQALNIWQQDMQRKGDSVTGPMLVEKHAWLEVLFSVPAEERLHGTGWLKSFKRAYVIFFNHFIYSHNVTSSSYKLKEHRRHQENMYFQKIPAQCRQSA